MSEYVMPNGQSFNDPIPSDNNTSEYELKNISFKANVDFCIANGDWQKATITKFYDYKDVNGYEITVEFDDNYINNIIKICYCQVE